MALQVDEVAVTGGYRIIDTDRHPAYQGVAIVVQRDAHPVIADCEISHAEALGTAKAMAAAPELLAALVDLLSRCESLGVDGVGPQKVAARQAIAKAAV